MNDLTKRNESIVSLVVTTCLFGLMSLLFGLQDVPFLMGIFFVGIYITQSRMYIVPLVIASVVYWKSEDITLAITSLLVAFMVKRIHEKIFSLLFRGNTRP